MNKNPVCEILNIKYPIVQGGLAYVGNGELAAAVSNGGGLGVIGSAGRSPEDFQKQIEIASSKTDKPIGVNLPLSEHSDNTPYINIILDNVDKLSAVSISAGNPNTVMPFFKETKLKILIYVATVAHAIKAEEIGADIVICEGFEAGGHLNPLELTLFGLIPQVTKKVNVPVIAAGAITNGQGLVAAMALGAKGIQIGTLFIATKECQAHDNYKQLLIDSDDTATTIVGRSNNLVMRVANSGFIGKVQALEKTQPSIEELLPYIKGQNNHKAAIEGELEEGWVNAGQGTGLIKSIISATDVVGNVVDEANEVFKQLGSIEL